MSQRITIHFARPIAVFPLPGCVPLPHNLQPLHIFEPRYRQMVGDALDSTGLVAMGQFVGHVDREAYLNAHPPLRECVCLGYIEEYETLDDGRLLIMLRGLCRAKIVREVPHEPYRTAVLEPTEWPPASDEDLAEQRDVLRELLDDPAFDALEDADPLRDVFETNIPTAALLDLLIDTVCLDTEERYTMLKQHSARSRAGWLINRMAYLRDVARTTGPPDYL